METHDVKVTQCAGSTTRVAHGGLSRWRHARLALHCVLRALRLREGLGEPLLQRGALRGARRKWSDRRRKRIFHVCKILRPFTMRRGGARLARRIPPEWLRAGIVLTGLVMAGVFFWRQ